MCKKGKAKPPVANGKPNSKQTQKNLQGQKAEKRRVKVRLPEVDNVSHPPTSKQKLAKHEDPVNHAQHRKQQTAKPNKGNKSSREEDPVNHAQHRKQQAAKLSKGNKKSREEADSHRKRNNEPTPLIRPKPEAKTSKKKNKQVTISEASSTAEVHSAEQHSSDKASVEKDRPTNDNQNMQGHMEKIRSFVRHLINEDIRKSGEIFETMKGLMPRNATRLAFDTNIKKCRFVDVICIDQSRVLVNSANNFIHASRVPITEDGKNEMILTQLPMKHTVMDFWHMVWDENVQSVFAVLTEGEWSSFGRNLKLVPKMDCCLHKSDGLCIVFQQQVIVSSLWSLTSYGLSWKGVHRSIEWIHYTGWEHGQAPKETETIWQIHSYLRRSKKPVVCMSLSGIGRAGTYAILEMAHERIHNKQNKRVQLTDCVQKVRDARMHALQNRIQFGFIQIALMDHLLGSEKIRDELKGQYLEKYRKLRETQIYHEDAESVKHSNVGRTSEIFQ